jgi:phosphoribosyl 1,2-cyclic phosphodiesterase
MIVTFWGVRGSRPVPGPTTVRYGGNTACVSVQRDRSLLVIDAGTGIVPLGERLERGWEEGRVDEVLLLLTHRHMDHVQGLPFFEALHAGGPRVTLLDLPVEGGFWTPLALFDGVAVPMPPPRGDSRVARADGDPVVVLRDRGWEIERLDLRHPGGAAGYRIGDAGRSFVHLTDAELDAADPDDDYFDRCVAFCRRADVLSHDAQYLAEEMVEWRGRGHSSVERVCDLAVAAEVGRLVLFHHDPSRDDVALDAIGQLAEERLSGVGIGCVVAREGLSLKV